MDECVVIAHIMAGALDEDSDQVKIRLASLTQISQPM
jgi:hypothetical protein